MNDKELLELAAKAAGVKIKGYYADGWPFLEETGVSWNPLEHDGDALRLAVKLGLLINIKFGERKETEVLWEGCAGDDAIEKHRNDPYAATRKAIVRAAAEIGKELP